MAKRKVKQKRTIGQRLASTILIALAPIVIDFVVDKISQAHKNHQLSEKEEGKKEIKDVTNSLD